MCAMGILSTTELYNSLPVVPPPFRYRCRRKSYSFSFVGLEFSFFSELFTLEGIVWVFLLFIYVRVALVHYRQGPLFYIINDQLFCFLSLYFLKFYGFEHINVQALEFYIWDFMEILYNINSCILFNKVLCYKEITSFLRKSLTKLVRGSMPLMHWSYPRWVVTSFS